MFYVIACAKDEEYIKEFCDWYLDLGFNKIILADNGLSAEQLKSIESYINEGLVELQDWHGKRVFQLDFYNKVVEQFTDDDWIAKVDVDEFIDLNGMKIQEYVKRFPKDCCSIAFNWMIYSSTEVHTTDLLSQARPSWTNNYWEIYSKCIFRYKSKLNELDEHGCTPKDGEDIYPYHCCGLKKSEVDIPDHPYVDFRFGFCRHYRTLDLIKAIAKYHRWYPNCTDARCSIGIETPCNHQWIIDEIRSEWNKNHKGFSSADNYIETQYYNKLDNRITGYMIGLIQLIQLDKTEYTTNLMGEEFNKLKIVSLALGKDLQYKK